MKLVRIFVFFVSPIFLISCIQDPAAYQRFQAGLQQMNQIANPPQQQSSLPMTPGFSRGTQIQPPMNNNSQIPVNKSLNCSSSVYGNTVNTNCY
jgi:hypothetical protein